MGSGASAERQKRYQHATDEKSKTTNIPAVVHSSEIQALNSSQNATDIEIQRLREELEEARRGKAEAEKELESLRANEVTSVPRCRSFHRALTSQCCVVEDVLEDELRASAEAEKKLEPVHRVSTRDGTCKTVLVTGAMGYIGSHAVRALLSAGHKVVGIDNFSTSQRETLLAVKKLPGAGERFVFVEGDVGDAPLVKTACAENNVTAVMHFAAFANLRESLDSPESALMYYRNNTAQALGLLEGIQSYGQVTHFVFSSTCCTYGDVPAEAMPIRESTPTTGASGAYGKSKLAIEFMLHDYYDASVKKGRPFSLAVLRYFNVAGCSRDGVLGEARDKQIRIIPILLDAALGKRDGVSIFGIDFPTRDGTAIRDYIHVEDLVRAHVHVLEHMEGDNADMLFNLGIGQGYSIRELIAATHRVTGVKLKVTEMPRVPGEAAEVFCDPSKVKEELGWAAEVTEIDDIVRSAFEFFKAHPHGYKE